MVLSLLYYKNDYQVPEEGIQVAEEGSQVVEEGNQVADHSQVEGSQVPLDSLWEQERNLKCFVVLQYGYNI